MKRLRKTLALVAMACLTGQPAAAQMRHAMTCPIQDVELTGAAERQLGGASYPGPKLSAKEIMATMAKAHQVHHPQRAGAFFMAPNKMNHLEVIYSKACGARVYIYNAYTVPIRVDRFLAYVEFVPRDEDAIEVTRFLQPSGGGAYLATGANHGVEPPFDIRLFMKFPDSDRVEMFNVKLASAQQPMVMATGVVIEVDRAAGKLVIDQAAIPGYMGAMTMPYLVASPNLLDRIEPGMKIMFTIDREKNIIVKISPLIG